MKYDRFTIFYRGMSTAVLATNLTLSACTPADSTTNKQPTTAPAQPAPAPVTTPPPKTTANPKPPPAQPVPQPYPTPTVGQVRNDYKNPYFNGFVALDEYRAFSQGEANCGPASVRTVIAYLTGQVLVEKSLASEMRTYDYHPLFGLENLVAGDRIGVTPVGITYGLNKYLAPKSLRTRYRVHSNWADMYNTILWNMSRGYPTIAAVKTIDRASHYVTIIGYDPTGQRLLIANTGSLLTRNPQRAADGGHFEIVPFQVMEADLRMDPGFAGQFEDQWIAMGKNVGLAPNLLIIFD